MTFGARLKAERQRLGLTQQELADTLGIHVNSQSAYETGGNSPTADYLEQIIAKGFNVNFLFHGVHDQVGASTLVADIVAILVALPVALQATCFAMLSMFRRSPVGVQAAGEQAEDFSRAARLFDHFLNLSPQGKGLVETAAGLNKTPPTIL